jgi:hypothetical protein
MPSVTPAASRAGKLAGCVAICAIALSALGLGVHHDLQETAAFLSKPSVKSAEANTRLEECVYRSIRSRLPRGAKFYVPYYWWGDEVRVYDLATLWAVPQPEITTAKWAVSLVRGKECEGRSLKVRRR